MQTRGRSRRSIRGAASFIRTQTPATISTWNTRRFTWLPSSNDPPPEVKPKMPSHCETNLDPQIDIQISGIQSAPVTFGRSRKSRRKRKIMNATVSKSAKRGGIDCGGRVQKAWFRADDRGSRPCKPRNPPSADQSPTAESLKRAYR
jgi:hypothetical protein